MVRSPPWGPRLRPLTCASRAPVSAWLDAAQPATRGRCAPTQRTSERRPRTRRPVSRGRAAVGRGVMRAAYWGTGRCRQAFCLPQGRRRPLCGIERACERASRRRVQRTRTRRPRSRPDRDRNARKAAAPDRREAHCVPRPANLSPLPLARSRLRRHSRLVTRGCVCLPVMIMNTASRGRPRVWRAGLESRG